MSTTTLVRTSLQERPDDTWCMDILKPVDQYPVHVQRRAEEFNFDLGFRFLQDMLEDKSLSDRIPDGAHIIHIIEGEEEVNLFNLALGVRAAEQGKRVFIVRWEKER